MDVRLSDVHVALPATIQRYDNSTQFCDVQPSLTLRLVDEVGNVTTERLPVITNVPVIFPRGGGFFMSLPVAVGDQVMVIVCERSLDLWKSKGGEIDPIDRRYHTFQGAVAYPGLYDGTKSLNNSSGSDLVVGKDGGSLVTIKSGGDVEIATSGKVTIGASATEIDLSSAADFVALAQKALTELTNIANNVNANYLKIVAAMLTGSTATGPVTFASPFAPTTCPTPNSVAASKVKAT